jgi:hypothetical protein
MKYSLQTLSDRLEIEDLITEYADAIDSMEIDRLDQVFMPDAWIDYSAMGGAVGAYPEVKAFLLKAMPAFHATQHLIANYKIQIKGNAATGKIMCFNPLQLKLGKVESEVFFLGLWYVDEYVRTESGWRISRRVEQKSYEYNLPEFMKKPG